MKYRVIKYKDGYNNVYTTEPIPSSDVKRKIRSIQETNDNKAVIISIQQVMEAKDLMIGD